MHKLCRVGRAPGLSEVSDMEWCWEMLPIPRKAAQKPEDRIISLSVGLSDEAGEHKVGPWSLYISQMGKTTAIQSQFKVIVRGPPTNTPYLGRLGATATPQLMNGENKCDMPI